MNLIGILLVLISIAFTVYWVTSHGSHKGTIVTLCFLTVFAGLALILQERITELDIKGVGTIKEAVQQITSDAKSVAELKKRVENQSATVDLAAKEASNAKALFEEVADKNKRAEDKLGKLDKAIDKAHTTLEELEATTEFTMAVVAAQNDDRKAFDKLKLWAEDKAYRFSGRAQQAWNSILEEHSKPFFAGGFQVPWTEGFDPSKLTLPELSQQYQHSPAHLKPALLEYIWNRDDISKIDRLDFMLNVMQKDSSLTAVEYAGRYFISGTDQKKIKPLDVEYLGNWWREHRQEFKEKGGG